MARLFIPQVGNQLKLISNWDCKVFNEYRNSKVFDGLNVDVSAEHCRNANIDITFPKGTVLRVDRLYVRAPASSYDSITFTITACPIKSLIKARFWVKLMDANKIEFEEIVNDMDSQKKLKDLFRFVALNNEFQNSEGLEPQEYLLVSKEIYDYFSKKNNNVFTATFKINPEEFLSTITFENPRNFYSRQEEYKNLRKNALAEINNTFNELEVQLNMLPILDGWVFNFEENQLSVEIDKKLDLYGKIENSYWSKTHLGSYLSRDSYTVEYDKKMFPGIMIHKINDGNYDAINFEYQGKEVKFKNAKEFDKFVKSIRVSIPK